MAVEKETDILVVGSGAGALTAAIVAADNGMQVTVIEKSNLYGGTAATSGGVLWIPDSPLAAGTGHEDSPEEGFSYIKALAGDAVPDTLIKTYVKRAPEMLAYMSEHAALDCMAIPYTDYNAELPGGKLGYRSHQPASFDGRRLGADIKYLRPTHASSLLFGRMSWDAVEASLLITRTKGWVKALFKVLARYYGDVGQRLRSRRDRYLAGGNALIAQLKLSLDARGIIIERNVRLVELVRDGRRVVGAVVEREGQRQRISARRGVVLATGGFERSADLRGQYFKQPSDPGWSASQPNNTGDGLIAAQTAGAAVDRMDSGWWAPTVKVPGEESARPLFFERALPGSIIINQQGRRYLNEAASYHLIGQWMMERNDPDASTVPSFVLFDKRFRWRYPMGPVMPMIPDFLHSKAVRSIMVRATSWPELARKLGVDEEALTREIERFNANAKKGEDPDFGRGQQPYDRYYGDPRITPNPNLYPLDSPPYYALPLYPGDIGSNGGLLVNGDAQVLHEDGAPIPGLYAAGNVSASVMGRSYPGAGATLGPAMTFGYLAARHAAGKNI